MRLDDCKMSRALLIAPHADDESLFAAYLCQQYLPFVAVVYNEGREQELALAIRALGCHGISAPRRSKGDDEDAVEAHLISLRDPAETKTGISSSRRLSRSSATRSTISSAASASPSFRTSR